MNSIHTSKVLGLTSGSSLDGINAALLTTDGVDIFDTGKTFDIPYDDALRDDLRRIQSRFMEMSDEERRRIDEVFTEAHIAAARDILEDYPDIELIGFGGHVVCHRPAEHLLYQLGDAQKMADALHLKVAGNFRGADILAGGQGAPLSAIYHAALVQKLEKPLVVADIGGLTTLTFIGQNGELSAFDAGPGNAALNDWVRKHGAMSMDYNGRLGVMGQVQENILSSMMKHKFLALPPPKAATHETFTDKLEHLEGLSLEDGAATATAFIAEALVKAVSDFIPVEVKRIIICGGGAKNPTLMRFLRQKLRPAEVLSAEECGFDALGIEAQAFAFLAARRLNHLPTSYPFTTGALQEVFGGELFEPHF